MTGLEILRTSGSNHVSIASTSIDQRLKVWNLQINKAKSGVQGITVARGQDSATPVADVSSMAYLGAPSEQPGVIVCGVGMDVWRWHDV